MIGVTTLSGILAEMGDISSFDEVREIQKLSGWAWQRVVLASISFMRTI